MRFNCAFTYVFCMDLVDHFHSNLAAVHDVFLVTSMVLERLDVLRMPSFQYVFLVVLTCGGYDESLDVLLIECDCNEFHHHLSHQTSFLQPHWHLHRFGLHRILLQRSLHHF